MTSTGSSIDEAAQDFRQLNAQVETVQADLATYDGVETLYSQIQKMGRPVDAIAINAGIGVGGEFVKTDLQEELNLIELNVSSTVHLAKRVVKDMVDRGSGKILFTSSVVSQMPSPFLAVYAASKAFVHSFSYQFKRCRWQIIFGASSPSRLHPCILFDLPCSLFKLVSEALRNELKDTGVTVTALMPGATETNFFHRAGLDETKVGAAKKDDPAEVAKQGFDALMAGKDSTLAESLVTKIGGAIGTILPDTVTSEMNRKLNEPG